MSADVPNQRAINPEAAALGRVAVLFGGRSAEREVSLNSGGMVLAALRRCGVDAHAFDPQTQDLRQLAEGGFDRAFIALHGRYGEDGTIQGALELMGIPYTGSGVLASALAMDKWRTKLLWQSVGIPTAPFEMLHAESDFSAVAERLGLPLMVKPASEGSSIGMSKVHRAEDLAAAYALAASYDRSVIAEAFIDGIELTVGILGDAPLPAIRLQTPHDFYDYDAKYRSNDTHYHLPCGLEAMDEENIQMQALEAFLALDCNGWGRVDLMVDVEGNTYFLEVNTAPGMTDHSLVPMAARYMGLEFDNLCFTILQLASLKSSASSSTQESAHVG